MWWTSSELQPEKLCDAQGVPQLWVGSRAQEPLLGSPFEISVKAAAADPHESEVSHDGCIELCLQWKSVKYASSEALVDVRQGQTILHSAVCTHSCIATAARHKHLRSGFFGTAVTPLILHRVFVHLLLTGQLTKQ